jgi:hypothetical protein
VDELPQPVRAHFGERLPDLDRATQPLHILRRIGALDAIETAFRRGWDEVVKISHCSLQIIKSRFEQRLASTIIALQVCDIVYIAAQNTPRKP